MKKFIISTTLLLLLATVTSNAMWPWGNNHRNHKHNGHNKVHPGQNNNGTKPVGAPLDGGLLLLLGGAGVAYYAAKKQKSVSEE